MLRHSFASSIATVEPIDWLKSPNAALRGNAPLSLLDTDIDAEAMLDTLGRIEPGVFA